MLKTCVLPDSSEAWIWPVYTDAHVQLVHPEQALCSTLQALYSMAEYDTGVPLLNLCVQKSQVSSIPPFSKRTTERFAFKSKLNTPWCFVVSGCVTVVQSADQSRSPDCAV